MASREAIGNDSACRRIALGDGVGFAAKEAIDVVESLQHPASLDVLLGWVPAGQAPLEFETFGQVRTLMGGFGLRRPIDEGLVHYLSVRLGTVPALLHGCLRRDVLIASVARGNGGFVLTTESAWQRATIDAGATVLGIERRGVPVLDAGPPIPTERIRIVASCDDPPAEVVWGEPNDVHRAIGDRIADLVPEGSRVQYGPGPVGTALLEAIRRPIQIDTGMLTEAVVGLDRRGLLLGVPIASYLGGGQLLYDWAPGRVNVDRIEFTLDPSRLGANPPLIAVNTALEVDLDGQVNVESVGGSAVAGIGGHPDYAFGAARSHWGLSVIATPTYRGPHCTLVDHLSAPVSTPSHDTDVVVTEMGIADLRGLGRKERRRAIRALWP